MREWRSWIGIAMLALLLGITPLCADEDSVDDFGTGDVTDADMEGSLDDDVPEDDQGAGGGQDDSGGSGDSDDG